MTFSALLLIGASSNPHTIQIRAEHDLRMDSAHIFLGIAVLGHHVSRIDGGWLVKQAEPGFMTIDWRTFGKWDGLTRTEEGPRDVSIGQLNAVVRTIEGLGFPAASIRAWRVPAPVGIDGFQEGDKVLTIGEILLDLGSGDQARVTLDRWNAATLLAKVDPLDGIPLTNVSDTGSLYVLPDCVRDERAERDDALSQTRPIAALIASSVRTDAMVAGYDAPPPADVLCPEDREPFFTGGSGPTSISWNGHPQDLTSVRVTPIVTYALAGMREETFVSPVPDRLSASATSYGFELNEPYAATVAKADVAIHPDAVVLHFGYDLGVKARKGYDDDLRTAQDRVAALQALVPDRNDILVTRSPVQDDHDAIDVFVILRRGDLHAATQLETVGRRTGERRDDAAYVPFLSSCDAARTSAVTRALAASRRKAEALARVTHRRIRGLAAARIDIEQRYGMAPDPICGFDPRATLSTLAAGIRSDDERPFDGDPSAITLSRTLNAAWTLDRAAASPAPLVRAEYQAWARGSRLTESLEMAALIQAARQAVVDDPHIVSMYESEPYDSTLAGGVHAASESLVVLR